MADWDYVEAMLSGAPTKVLDDNDRESILAWNSLVSQIKTMKETLLSAKQFIENNVVDTGVCCCGDEIENHSWSNHSPVDSGFWSSKLMIDDIDKALRIGTY